jgi:hypothetical protein
MNINDFISIVKPYTMTSIERITCLYDSLEYVRKNELSGDIVECGVWRGGNILGIIEYLNYYSINDKNVWLYDTFNGMTEPDDVDVDYRNNPAKNSMHIEIVKALSPIDEVKNNLSYSNFNKNNIKYIIGDVSDTLKSKDNLPKNISLLRLDTDWYKSTKVELEVLYPILSYNGILIVDDYGHWQGAKKAVDEYFIDSEIDLEKIDYTGIRLFKKQLKTNIENF